MSSKREIIEAISEIDDVKEENREYYEENLQQLKREHGGKYVAIFNGGDDIESAEGGLDEMYNFQQELEQEYSKEEIEQSYIQYVPERNKKKVL